MAASALAEFRVPVMAAHMFVFYFGNFANTTPPAALAAFAGGGLAGGSDADRFDRPAACFNGIYRPEYLRL